MPGTATDETTEVTGDTSDTSDTTPGSGTGGGEVGTQDEYVEATATAVGYEDEAFNQCIAEAVVSDEVYAAIEESGRTVEEFQSGGPADLGLEEEQVMAVADEMAACGDLIPQVVQNEDERACVEASIDNNQMAQVLALSTFGLELTEELNAASDEVDACVEGLSATTTT